jgi:hypothetical protein
MSDWDRDDDLGGPVEPAPAGNPGCAGDDDLGDGVQLVVYEIQVGDPEALNGHVLGYVSSDDLFRCERCGRYEITLEDPDTPGALTPCPGAPA